MQLKHSNALEGGRIVIDLNVDDDQGQPTNSENKLDDEQLLVVSIKQKQHNEQETEQEADSPPLVRRGSSRSGKRRLKKVVLPGKFEVHKRCKQQVDMSEDEYDDEQDEYEPSGEFTYL